MIRRTLLAALAASGLVGSASAEVLFQGELVWTAVTPGCAGGPNLNGLRRAQFHPSIVNGLPQSYNASALNTMYDYGMNGYKVENGIKGSNGIFPLNFLSPSPVSSYGVGWSNFTPNFPANVKITAITPNILSTTPVIGIVGAIQNPYFNSTQTTCVANFRFTGLLSIQ